MKIPQREGDTSYKTFRNLKVISQPNLLSLRTRKEYYYMHHTSLHPYKYTLKIKVTVNRDAILFIQFLRDIIAYRRFISISFLRGQRIS